jgi:tetratricopeptide (TPR) repeat protein
MENKSILHKHLYRICPVLLFLPLFFAGQITLADDTEEIMLKGIDAFNEAYNRWDYNLFISSLKLFTEAKGTGKKDGLSEYWMGAVYFFLTQHDLYSTTGAPDKKRGIENVKRGIEVLSKSIELSPGLSESYALRGVLRGILIKMKPSSAFSQGRKVAKDRETALALDKLNPRVHYLTGVSLWHTPEIIGGRDKALTYLLEAERLFEIEALNPKDRILPAWGRSTCLAFIGDIYLYKNESDMAYQYYKKAIDVNPADPLALKGLNKLKTSG